ncbi:MAG: DUF58 domain-containing protein [Phycicoccus sp.]|nr:DUF58 domain-containing protein [Phycicoccus sp.]
MTTTPNAAGALPWVDRLHTLAARTAPLRAPVRVVTGYGWAIAASTVILAVAGAALGWAELLVVAVGLATVLVIALALTLGGAPVDLTLSLLPPRVRAGASSRAWLVATNSRTRRVRSASLELPVGEALGAFRMRGLPPGEHDDFTVDIPTSRRGIIVVGPVRIVRGDPLGLAKRSVSSSASIELFVHPRVLPIPSLDAGFVRDLEGRPTSDPSVSDLDFHTLRPYVPGDDRRHVHWQSSARVSAQRGTTTLMMKGYTDTRRSHLGLVVDGRLAGYADDAAFEDAVTAAASIAVRALRDDMDVTVVAADHALDRVGIVRTLDGFARVAPSATALPVLAARLTTLAPGTSIAILVTGGDIPFRELQRASAQFGPQVRIVVVRVAPEERSSTSSVLGFTVLTLGSLSDLARIVDVAGAA